MITNKTKQMTVLTKTIPSDNGDIEIILQRRRRCRYLCLRYHPIKRHCVLSAPFRTSQKEIQHFLTTHTKQMQGYVAALPSPIPLSHGTIIPVLGVSYRIQPTPVERLIEQEPFPLVVPTTPAKSGKQAMRLLEQELKRYINESLTRILADPLLADIQKTPTIRLSDPVSRWGSCSPDGAMMFSKRLVFAPRYVLDYVIAHECAHLVHLNHGQAFWALNAALCPGMSRAKQWLKQHGHELFRYQW